MGRDYVLRYTGRICIGLVAWILLAPVTPASAQIYRWRDDAGKEHFAQDLESIPERHREPARARWAESGRRISVTGPAEQTPNRNSARPGANLPAKPGQIAPNFDRGGFARPSHNHPNGQGALSESHWRSGYRRHRAQVDNARRHLESVKSDSNAPDDLIYSARARSDHNRARWERGRALRANQRDKAAKIAGATAGLARAEAELEAFVEQGRRAGAPPGWLR